MLQNEYLVAKIGVDLAENEPLKVWRKIQVIIHSPPHRGRVAGEEGGALPARAGAAGVVQLPGLDLGDP